MKEITDEYLLSLVQKEEYAVMGGKLIVCTLIIRNGSMVCGDPVFIGKPPFYCRNRILYIEI